MCEREEELRPKYKVVGDFDELTRKSEHWDRLYPEVVEWREREEKRIEMEAASSDELLTLRAASVQAEIDAFPEMWNRMIIDAKEEIMEEFISHHRMRYLFLFGVINPESVRRNKEATVRVYIDWDEALK